MIGVGERRGEAITEFLLVRGGGFRGDSQVFLSSCQVPGLGGRDWPVKPLREIGRGREGAQFLCGRRKNGRRNINRMG